MDSETTSKFRGPLCVCAFDRLIDRVHAQIKVELRLGLLCSFSFLNVESRIV